mgnify:CR=1 FL=1
MFRIEAFGLPEEACEPLVRGVAGGEYSLLLGSGFSLGARNGSGQLLPSSEQLAQELKEEFSLLLDIEGPGTLPLAYEDSLAKAGEEFVSRFLKRRLTGCLPTWHRAIAGCVWRRVWTLNIDDLPPAIFRDLPIREFDFDSTYRVFVPGEDLQIIYLHGRAAVRGRRIFSIQEYHDSVRGAGDWHTAFFTEFKERPFIACGASLVGEFDLAKTLRASNQSLQARGLPSIAVSKGLSPASAQRLNDRLGLRPVDASGEEFFSALVADVKDYIARHPELLPGSTNPTLARIFGQQFQPLTVDRPGRVPARQDFYAGDEPLWADIINDRDAPLTFGKQAVDFIRKGLKGGVPIVSIVGDAGCGKSTTLLRCAKSLSPLPCFLFRGEEDLNISAVMECIRRSPAVLLFDNAGDFSVTIGQLYREAINSGVGLGLIISDRKRRERGISVDLGASDFLRIDHSAVTPSDAIAVIEKRRDAKRLGGFGRTPISELRKLIVSKHHGNLLSALSEVDFGAGFKDRIARLGAIVQKRDEISVLALAVAQTHRWGYPLPLHMAAAASGIATDAVLAMSADGGELSDILFIERRGVRFRHRVLAEKTFEQCKDYELLTAISKGLVDALSPLVNVEAIRAKSYPHRLCKVLMDRHSVLATVGGDIDRAREWYASVQDNFGWNSRYWEQRALLELEAEQFSAAYSFAKAAVDKERHPFPYTTFGTVCLIAAGHASSESHVEAFDLYKEGEAALQEAVAIGRNRPETLLHPITSYFEYTERLWAVLDERQDSSKRLRSDWSGWLVHAEQLGYFKAFPDRERALKHMGLRSVVSKSGG